MICRLLYFLLLIGSIVMSSAVEAANLTAITWAHAVNNQSFLTQVLKSDVQFIEADIVIGTLINESELIPIMGHPPNNVSDLSLVGFLNQILEFNKNTANKKGVKLDFKQIEVFNQSLSLLKSLWSSMNYPVWINADILAGPVNNTDTIPVDADLFFKGCKELPAAVLSIGWTTKWGANYTDGNYTNEQIHNMITAIDRANIENHPITFPVRAGIAAQSKDSLVSLVSIVNQTHPVTLTIWSSVDDNVNIDKLRQLIFSFGLDRVYVDVPEEVASKLDLGNAPGHASILKNTYSFLSVIMLITSLLLSFGLF